MAKWYSTCLTCTGQSQYKEITKYLKRSCKEREESDGIMENSRMRKTSTRAWCDAELPGCQCRKRQYFEPQNPVSVYTAKELGLNLILTQNSVWSLCIASSTYRCRSAFRGHLSL